MRTKGGISIRVDYKRLEGLQLEDLKVLEYLGRNDKNTHEYKCLCECGKIVVKSYNYLKKPKTASPKSCGCKEKVGIIEFNKRTKTGFNNTYKKINNKTYSIEVKKKNKIYEVLVNKKGLEMLLSINRTLSIDSRGYPFITKPDANGRQMFLMNIFKFGLDFYNNENKNDILVDHINGNKLDNRLENLRVANQFENTQNAKRRKDNTLGIKGFTLRDSKRPMVKVNCRIQTYHHRVSKDAPLSREGLKWLIAWDIVTRHKLHDKFSNYGFEVKNKTINEVIKEQESIFIENLSPYYLNIFNNNGYKYIPKKFKRSQAIREIKNKLKDINLNDKIA